jgi:putative ATP-dependent endonuclease of OLD family
MAKAKAKAAGSQKAGLERQADLTKFTADNPWLAIFYAKHTFEVDFVAAGNHEAVVQTIPTVYKDEKQGSSETATPIRRPVTNG